MAGPSVQEILQGLFGEFIPGNTSAEAQVGGNVAGLAGFSLTRAVQILLGIMLIGIGLVQVAAPAATTVAKVIPA